MSGYRLVLKISQISLDFEESRAGSVNQINDRYRKEIVDNLIMWGGGNGQAQHTGMVSTKKTGSQSTLPNYCLNNLFLIRIFSGATLSQKRFHFDPSVHYLVL
jgi:hypothetical protein